MERFKLARPRAALVQGRADWYKINNLAGKSEIYIYDEIGYVGVTARDFTSDLSAIRDEEIDLHLNTPGGEVFDGIAIYNALKNHPAKVNVYIDALAASIGSVIAMAGDNIQIARQATMMIHDGHGMCVGNASDMRDMVNLLDKTSDNIASIYAERTGSTSASWRKAMKAETWYNAEEAVKANLADSVSGMSNAKTENTWDLSIFNFSGRQESPVPEIEPVEETWWDAETVRAALKEAAS